jgi:hypothetical protein
MHNANWITPYLRGARSESTKGVVPQVWPDICETVSRRDDP